MAKKRKTKTRRKKPRIPRDILLNTVQVGPVIETQAIAFAARTLLMNMYALDVSIWPFGEGKFQLRLYDNGDYIARRYADFFTKQLNDLFTWPQRRLQPTSKRRRDSHE